MSRWSEWDKDKRRAFLRLCRPQFLVPGFLLYVLGYLLATTRILDIDPQRFVLGYVVFFFAHFSLTFSNDYFDLEADSLNTPTRLSGGSGVLGVYPEMASIALVLSRLLIFLSLLSAIFFHLSYSMPWYFLPLVIGGNFLGYYYSAPPLRLAYRGWGEVSTMVAVGLIMPGMGYLCAYGSLDAWFLLLTPPLVAYSFFFILSVEMPDVEGDRAGGKMNWLVRLGLERGTRVAFVAVILASLYWSSLIYGRLIEPIGFDLLVLLLLSTMPIAASIMGLRRDVRNRDQVVQQVKVNFSSILIYLVFANAYLFFNTF